MKSSLLAIALVALPAATAIGDEGTAHRGVSGSSEGPTELRVDADGDGIFDDLEHELAGRGAGAEVDVIVQLRSDASAARVRALQRQVGHFAVEDRFSIIDGFAARVSKAQVRTLAREPAVTRVEEDVAVRAQNSSAQAAFGITKARADAPGLDGDADGDPAIYSGDDLVTAVVDTGIDASHPDLDEGKVIAFKDFVGGITTPYDDNGHGTHIAGTIAGEGDNGNPDGQGVAPGAALVGVKVLGADAKGTTSNVVAGIDWVVAHKETYGIEAINLSLASSGCGGNTTADALAVNRANAAGLVVAVAAGNNGPGACTVGAPGSASGALTVGAMADTGVGGFMLARFSSRGTTADGRIKPDVVAPGVSIISAAANTAGYATNNGTSMAAPFVAGTALLMLDANPALTPTEVKAKIKSTAVDWGLGGDYSAGSPITGEDIDYGAGRLDAYAALASAGAPLVEPPPVPTHEFRRGSLPATGAQVDYPINVTNAAFPIAATLIHPGVTAKRATTPNFNIYLLAPNGAQIASAVSGMRQDELSYQPTVTGTYTLRVRSASGGGAYFVDISAGSVADTVAPIVTGQTPADGATGVDRAANLGVTFSEPMDRAATEAAFTLVRAGDPGPLPGTFSWAGTTMTFNPSADLARGAQYTATVAGGAAGARDPAGNGLVADASASFVASSASLPGSASPTTATIEPGGGTLLGGTAARLTADDNVFYRLASTTSGTRTTSWYGTFTGLPSGLENLTVSYSGKNSQTCTQTVGVFRWADSTWVPLDSRSVGTTEVLLSSLPAPGAATDYVNGAGELRVRVHCTATKSFNAIGDFMRIAYELP